MAHNARSREEAKLQGVCESMSEDFHSAPVPIRMSCRYSNGLTVSYGARALAYDDSSLRVLSSEDFARGITLNIFAPFWEGITACRVAASARNRKQPAYFELELSLLKKPLPAARAKKKPAVEQTRKAIPQKVAFAAEQMAAALELAADKGISQVWRQLPPSRRPLFLTVSAAAVLLLLQEKGLLDVQNLLAGAKERLSR